MKHKSALYILIFAAIMSLSIHADEDLEGMRFMVMETDGIVPPEIVVNTVKEGAKIAAVATVCFVGWKYRRNILKDLTTLKNDTSIIKADTSILKKDAAEIKNKLGGMQDNILKLMADVGTINTKIDTYATLIKDRLYQLYKQSLTIKKDVEGIRKNNESLAQEMQKLHTSMQSHTTFTQEQFNNVRDTLSTIQKQQETDSDLLKTIIRRIEAQSQENRHGTGKITQTLQSMFEFMKKKAS